MRSFLEFEFSAWFILLCVALGILYAYVQYDKEVPWANKTNRLLASARTILVAITAILLLGPLVRAIQNYKEAPVMVVALDNSESVLYASDSIELKDQFKKLNDIGDALTEKGWQVQYRDLSGRPVLPDTILFNETRSNLTRMIRSIQNEFDGANLGGMIIVSDGIFNSGFSPDLISSYTPIYGVGLGDTIPKADLSLIDIRYSKTVYQENKFPISLKIKNEGLGPINTSLRLYQGETQIESRNIAIRPDQRLLEEEFLIDADQPGKQRYSIRLDPVPGEANVINNRATAYIDIIDGKQKVLIVADAPNPDIRAIRLAIANIEQFEVDVIINEPIPTGAFDLIIFAHSPSRAGSNSRVLLNSATPKLFIVGIGSDRAVLASNNVLTYANRSNQYDQVTASINVDFKAFNVVGDLQEWLGKAPPVVVPFGNILLPPNAQVLLYQKVGAVETSRPYIYILEDEPKTGAIIGDGFWKWRLDEYRKYGETSRFDELVSKLTKYLASKPDNRQFKLYPIKDGFEEGEQITFEAETYNEIFEPLYGEAINIRVTGYVKSWDYDFTPIEGNTQIVIDDLVEGLYAYSASTFLNGQQVRVNGQFSVSKPDLEASDLTADHLILQRLASESGGAFYTISQLEELTQGLNQLETPAILHTQDKELLLLNLPWILILILTLATGEWLTRKMMGSY